MIRRYLAAFICVASVSNVSAADLEASTPPAQTYEQRKAALKAACDTCKAGVKKDPGEWDISAALGFTLAQGNADTTLLTAEGLAAREIGDDIYSLGFNGAVGEQNSVDTQRYIRGDAGYKHLLSDKVYASAGLAYLTDDIASVDYRIFLNPGIGYFFIKDEDLTLNVETGPSYVFQKQAGDKDNFLAWRVANRFEWKFSETGKIFQGTEFLLNTDDTEDYLINAEAGIEAALNSKLSLVVSIRDRFDASPAADVEQNDVILTTGFKVSL